MPLGNFLEIKYVDPDSISSSKHDWYPILPGADSMNHVTVQTSLCSLIWVVSNRFNNIRSYGVHAARGFG